MNTDKRKSQDSKIVVPCTKTYDFILVSDIIRCEGMQSYTRIFLKNGQSVISSRNIGVYKDMLVNYDFFPCHKSHLINKKQIRRYFKDGYVEMSDASQVPVSRRQKVNFFQEIINHFEMVSARR